jgi:hypothetical protein
MVAGVVALIQQLFLRTRNRLPSLVEVKRILGSGVKLLDGDDENDNANPHTNADYIRVDVMQVLNAAKYLPVVSLSSPAPLSMSAKEKVLRSGVLRRVDNVWSLEGSQNQSWALETLKAKETESIRLLEALVDKKVAIQATSEAGNVLRGAKVYYGIDQPENQIEEDNDVKVEAEALLQGKKQERG